MEGCTGHCVLAVSKDASTCRPAEHRGMSDVPNRDTEYMSFTTDTRHSQVNFVVYLEKSSGISCGYARLVYQLNSSRKITRSSD